MTTGFGPFNLPTRGQLGGTTPHVKSLAWFIYINYSNYIIVMSKAHLSLFLLYSLLSPKCIRLANACCINKWKNHFVEMKGDVVMSVHEKGGKQANATPTHKTIYNPIPTSL